MKTKFKPTYNRYCLICLEHKKVSLLKFLRYHFFDDLQFSGISNILSCNNCGMVYNEINDGEKALLNYYKKNDYYLNSFSPGSGGLTKLELKRYKRLFKLLNLKKKYSILDFGCGKGGMLKWLNCNNFFNLTGIEASDSCRASVENCNWINIYANTDDLPKNFCADIIVISHVLEHLYNPLIELKKLIEKSSPDARFFIEVPNTAAILKSSNPWLYLFFEHINHFDKISLNNLVSFADLEILESGCWSFDPSHGPENECLYLVCRPVQTNLKEKKFLNVSRLSKQFETKLTSRPLSDSFIQSLDLERPLALWGCSQYAMLVLGMHEELRVRLRRLFDASPAKIGRSIAGIEIQHPSHLRTLSNDYLLLLPQSAYLDAMLKELSDANLNFDTVIF